MQIKKFYTNRVLDFNGEFYNANFELSDGVWSEFSVGSLVNNINVENYIVPTLPVEIHIHGISQFDFSHDNFFDLEEVDRNAREEGILCIPSIFLAQNNLDNFIEFMKKYNAYKEEGKLDNIPGISLEGPLLGSFGGTPKQGTWLPSTAEWKKVISCANLGLKYIVLSPDALSKGSCLYSNLSKEYPSLDWIADEILKSGIKISIGHFHKKNSKKSASLINVILNVAKKYYPENVGSAVMVDHFFNDMPSNIKYAWRTPECKDRREVDLKNLKINEWTINNIEEILGIVPSTIIKAAKRGDLTVCLNFDGEHVETLIAQKVVELIGPQNVCAMTDRTEVNTMGNITLSQRVSSNLWYQQNGAVAAGTSTIDEQMKNLRLLGFNESEVWTMCSFVPYKFLGISHLVDINKESSFSLVTKERERFNLEFIRELVLKP